jgi:hypothetical protein
VPYFGAFVIESFGALANRKKVLPPEFDQKGFSWDRVGSFLQPGDIPAVRRGIAVIQDRSPIPDRLRFDLGIHELVDFGMTVGERKWLGVVVIAGWVIMDHSGSPALATVYRERSSHDAVCVLDGEYPMQRWGGITEIGDFVVNLVQVAERARIAEGAVHGDAANAGQVRTALLGAAITGTFVYTERRVVLPEVAGLNVSDVRRVAIVGHIAADPAFGRIGVAVIILDERPVVVIGIHEPGKLELPQVTGAHRGLALDLCLAQGGQKHPGEDGDNRDYDQQFYQGETAIANAVRLRHFPRKTRF